MHTYQVPSWVANTYLAKFRRFPVTLKRVTAERSLHVVQSGQPEVGPRRHAQP